MCSNSSTLLDNIDRQLIMYLLDICMSYSTLLIFAAHNGSRETLKELSHKLHHNYLITTEK